MNTYQDNRTTGAEKPIEKRTPEVIEACSRLDNAIERAMKGVSGLSSRLQPVTRATVPQSAKNPNPERVPMVPLAERIVGAAELIESLADQISDLSSRVEL